MLIAIAAFVPLAVISTCRGYLKRKSKDADDGGETGEKSVKEVAADHDHSQKSSSQPAAPKKGIFHNWSRNKLGKTKTPASGYSQPQAYFASAGAGNARGNAPNRHDSFNSTGSSMLGDFGMFGPSNNVGDASRFSTGSIDSFEPRAIEMQESSLTNDWEAELAAEQAELQNVKENEAMRGMRRSMELQSAKIDKLTEMVSTRMLGDSEVADLSKSQKMTGSMFNIVDDDNPQSELNLGRPSLDSNSQGSALIEDVDL